MIEEDVGASVDDVLDRNLEEMSHGKFQVKILTAVSFFFVAIHGRQYSR